MQFRKDAKEKKLVNTNRDKNKSFKQSPNMKKTIKKMSLISIRFANMLQNFREAFAFNL